MMARSSAPAARRGKQGASIEQQLDRVRAERRADRYLLRLYIAGMTVRSAEAIERVRGICEEHLSGRYALEVIDIHQLPALAKGEQIVATPTLIRVLPAPLRRYIGTLSREQLLFGLDLRPRRS